MDSTTKPKITYEQLSQLLRQRRHEAMSFKAAEHEPEADAVIQRAKARAILRPTFENAPSAHLLQLMIEELLTHHLGLVHDYKAARARIRQLELRKD